MTQKTFKFAVACITGISTIASAAIAYFVQDQASAAIGVSIVSILSGAAIEICDLFVKDKQ